MYQDSVSPLLKRVFENDKIIQDDLFKVAAKMMPITMLAVLEELRSIPNTLPLSMEFETHYHMPAVSGFTAHVNLEGQFTQYVYEAPTPEIVLKLRVFLNSDNRVRTVVISAMGLVNLHELSQHLAVNTHFTTYIGPYPWEDNWVLRMDQK